MPAIAELIESLTSLDAGVREPAAQAIHRLGVKLSEEIVRQWRKDPELALLLPEDSPVVGLAVLPETFLRIRRVMGSPPLAEVPPDQDAREFELRLAGVSLDVLTVRAAGVPAGAIGRFLRKFGEGIQQVEYLVTDVDRATEILRRRFDLTPIYPETRAGANRTRVNFFLTGIPKALIELVECAPDDDAA